MGIIATIICLFLLLICLKSTKGGLKNPFVLFYSLWFVILLFSSLRLYGMYVPSDKAYGLICLMNVFFFLGALVQFPRKKHVQVKNSQVIFSQVILNEGLIYFLVGISFLIKVTDFLAALEKLRSGMALWQVRQDAFSVYDIETGGLLKEVISNVIITPFNTILVPLVAYLVFREPSKRMTKVLVTYLVVSNIMGAASSGGGRLGYIYIAGCMIYSFAFLDKQKISRIYIKYKRKLRIVFFVMILLVVLFTIIRAGSENLFRQVYTYFGMAPTLMDVNLKALENSQYTYGMLTLFGIHSYIFRFFGIIGFELPDIYNVAYQYVLNANLFRQVGFGTANSFVSPVYYFYLDGGVVFVILASTVFGCLISNVITNVRNSMNEKNFCYYCLIMYAVFLSFMRVQTVTPSFIISLVMVSVIFKHAKVRIGKN